MQSSQLQSQIDENSLAIEQVNEAIAMIISQLEASNDPTEASDLGTELAQLQTALTSYQNEDSRLKEKLKNSESDLSGLTNDPKKFALEAIKNFKQSPGKTIDEVNKVIKANPELNSALRTAAPEIWAAIKVYEYRYLLIIGIGLLVVLIIQGFSSLDTGDKAGILGRCITQHSDQDINTCVSAESALRIKDRTQENLVQKE